MKRLLTLTMLVLALVTSALAQDPPLNFELQSTSHNFYAVGSPYKLATSTPENQLTNYVITGTSNQPLTYSYAPRYYGAQVAIRVMITAHGLDVGESIVTSRGTLTYSAPSIEYDKTTDQTIQESITIQPNQSFTKTYTVCVGSPFAKSTYAATLGQIYLPAPTSGLTQSYACIVLPPRVPLSYTLTKTATGSGISNFEYQVNNNGTWVSWSSTYLTVYDNNTYLFRARFQATTSGKTNTFKVQVPGISSTIVSNVPYPTAQYVQSSAQKTFTAAGVITFTNTLIDPR